MSKNEQILLINEAQNQSVIQITHLKKIFQKLNLIYKIYLKKAQIWTSQSATNPPSKPILTKI